MDTKILLNKANSKRSVNTSEGVNVSLEGKRRLLSTNDMSEVINQNEQYNEERASCDKIRLTCQVNPICSNVLFNKITEIVRNEGDENVSFINYGILNGDINPSFKRGDIEFWSGDTMYYESHLEEQLDANETMEEVINNYECGHKHYTNGYANYERDSSEKFAHPTNAIRDTQLSNSNNNFVYHCGLDMFNNHLIRSNTFKTVCKIKEHDDWNDPEDENVYDGFNTIADMMRDVSGNKVFEKIPYPTDAGLINNTKFMPLHLYEYDDVNTFEEAVEKKLVSRYDGWLGFHNKSKIKSYDNFSDGKSLEVERPIMYMNGGDFVDMYPDRTLYSFIPKYNKYRNRLEKNWNYCLTYPSSSTTDGFEDIIESNNGLNSLKAIYFDENTVNDNGVTQLVIYGICKHGLSVGDYVNIYKTHKVDNSFVNTKIIDNAEVKEIVDDYIFVVYNADVKISSSWVDVTDNLNNTIIVDNVTYALDQNSKKFYHSDSEKYYIIDGRSGYRYVNFDKDTQRISYKKVVGGIECEYYVRIFSRLPNFKFASGDTSNEYEIYRIRENGKSILEEYRTPQYDFESHVSKLAFARNVYSDSIGEIVFTDDINLKGIHDNLGRPLTSIYLTIVKNNSGYKEWYGFNNHNIDITSENIEYSHCFGMITCGFEMSDESSCINVKNIRTINNSKDYVFAGYNIEKINGNSDENPLCEISYNDNENYYGDLCYYDNYNAVEVSIQPILHRFNTAQRESNKSSSQQYFKTFLYDKIKYDDLDGDMNYTVEVAKSKKICNTLNEGYFYQPHHEIKINTFGDVETIYPDLLQMKSLIVNKNNNAEDGEDENVDIKYTITTYEHHNLSIGDKCVLFDRENNTYYDCLTVGGVDDSYNTFTCRILKDKGEIDTMLSNDDRLNDFELIKVDNLDIPSYARMLKDGTCRFIWRNVIKNGTDGYNNSVETYPFTNGALYVNKKVDLYVRRQDPHDQYMLYDDIDLIGEEIDVTTIDNYTKEDDIKC